MIEIFLQNTPPHDAINWEKWESIGTLVLAAVTVLSTGLTLWYSHHQVAYEQKKIAELQRQQTFKIVKDFYDKKNVSLMDGISFLSEKIAHSYYSLNSKNIAYLDQIKKKAIELETLDKQMTGLETEIKAEKDPSTLIEKQDRHQKIIDEMGKLNIWFAERANYKNIRSDI